MQKLIILEGAQGVGKTTLANGLREMLPYTNLFRLSGIEDATPKGAVKVMKARTNELMNIKFSKDCELNFIMDRCFVSEQVYSRLGYKEYSFEAEATVLGDYLESLAKHYDVHYITLTASLGFFSSRLMRDKAQYGEVAFNVKNSNDQQEMYLKIAKEMEERLPKIKFSNINTNAHSVDNLNRILALVNA